MKRFKFLNTKPFLNFFSASQIIKNIGWPYWYDFMNTQTLDEYHRRYASISDTDDWWEISKKLQYAYQMTESIGLLLEKPDRLFLFLYNFYRIY